MSSKTRPGRPTRPFKTSWGEEIHGLYRCPDGRYRINATGEKYTEHDERVAVKKFREWQERHGQQPVKITTMRVERSDVLTPKDETVSEGLQRIAEIAATGNLTITVEGDQPKVSYIANVPNDILWTWLRTTLINEPELVAKMTGIPEIANLRHMDLPRPPLELRDLIETYGSHGAARLTESKRSAIRALERLIEFCQAQTLADLTTEKLLAYRQSIEQDSNLPSGDTKKAYFARCRTVVAFGLKVGKDAAQIRGALDRMKVLWSAAPSSGVDPHPISREDFHQILNAAVGEWSEWRLWMLLALNLCLHLKDVCMLRWSDFDLAKKVYRTIRVKTEEDRIPQAAILWDETLSELRKLRRAGDYVLNSRHGTHYHQTSRSTAFREFREASGMMHIEFDHFRDGAYTAACRSRIDDKWARLLAGQRAEGLQDNYVLRNPEIVQPACDAVYEHYFGVANKNPVNIEHPVEPKSGNK